MKVKFLNIHYIPNEYQSSSKMFLHLWGYNLKYLKQSKLNNVFM
jgi:hypothetical protein